MMLKRNYAPFAVLITGAVLLVSFFLLSSASLLPTPPSVAKLPLSPTAVWSFTATNSTVQTTDMSWGTPIVANGIAYLTNIENYIIPEEPNVFLLDIVIQHPLTTIYAINASSGGRLWNFTAEGSVRSFDVIDGVASMSVSNSRNHNGQYVGASIFALDAVNGSQKWEYKIDGDIHWCSINDGAMYVHYVASGFNSYVCALNASSGKVVWRYNAGYYVFLSLPAFGNGAIYFGENGGHYYYAVNATNGSKLWRVAVGVFNGYSTLSDGIVYFNSDGTFYALNVQTGEILWSYPTAYLQVGADGIVYVRDGDNVSAFDASSGNQVWNYSANITIISSLSLVDNVIYFCTNGTLNALNPSDGTLLWSRNIDYNQPLEISEKSLHYSVFRTNATIADGMLYYYSGNTLYALETSNGNSLWNYTTANNLSFLTIADYTVFFAGGNSVYAFSIFGLRCPSTSFGS
jgi:outer membrane protein assembly factor BamB